MSHTNSPGTLCRATTHGSQHRRRQTMTDQFYQDVEERSEKLCVEEKPIQIACFCHKADHRDWKRLEQHLEAVQLQAQHLGCPMCWTTFECNPKDSTHRSQMEK